MTTHFIYTIIFVCVARKWLLMVFIHSFIKLIVVKAKNYVGIGTNHTEWLRIWVNFLGYLISCCDLPSLLILHTCILHRIIFHSNRWSFLTFVYAVSQTFIKFMDNIFLLSCTHASNWHLLVKCIKRNLFTSKFLIS